MDTSESENTEPANQDTKHENTSRKRVRHRKKQLYENILKQMEFYFSDANLTKDRFLANLIKNDPFVPLETFLKFNKIRSLTQDVNYIAKAMKHSTLLELSEDKLKVKRKTSVQSYDADARTVYVESIPVTASREWLQRVFSDYGNVVYISLPKFKNSHKIKGFAFIEFEKPEDAQKCIGTFTKMGCKLPTGMVPDELSSIRTFYLDDLDTQEKGPKRGKEDDDDPEPPKKKNRKSKEKKLHKNLELKFSAESECEKKLETPTDENKSLPTPTEDDTKSLPTPTEDDTKSLPTPTEDDTKSLPTPTEDDNKSLPTPTEDDNKSLPTPTEEVTTPDVESKDEMTSQDESKQDQDGPRKKKLRKKIGKTPNKTKENKNKNEAPKGALWGLQVLHKVEWKALRNKYLNLQRKFMKEIKNNLRYTKGSYSSIPEPAAPSEELEPVLNPAKGSRSETIAPLEKIPGVFIKEVLPEPCLDVRLTKRTIRSNVHVLHVEVKEGQTDVIIRFDSAKAAEEYCSARESARALCGAEEEQQWERAETARRAHRPRGRVRLQAAASRPAPQALAPASPQPTHTHIRFDDE